MRLVYRVVQRCQARAIARESRRLHGVDLTGGLASSLQRFSRIQIVLPFIAGYDGRLVEL